ncbi:MAG: exopolysaccharide biosynthesis polyprenyl glycosylphosphotransferase [Opitutales bacterium]|jgi:exopolysaccharide biosynthesis polyprenyl glycosylphosphotransferase
MPRSSNWNLGKGAWALLDLAVATCSAALVPSYWTPISETLREVSTERQLVYALCYGFSFLVAGEILGLHEAKPMHTWRFRVALAAFAAAGACMALLLLVYLIEYQVVGRFALLKIGGCSVASLALLRAAIGSLASRSRPRVLALVSEEVGRELAERVKMENVPIALEDPAALQKAGGRKVLADFCREHNVDEVVTMRSDRDQDADIAVVEVMASGARVSDWVDFWERVFTRVPPDYVDESWLARLDLRVRHPIFHRAKRFIDVLIAILGMIILSPVILLASIAIVLESGGPVFFSQRRVGFLGQSFVLHKLRTMRQDAEKEGAKWASEGDVRVTRVGKFLRLSRIDEIPQFWNVLKGEMSIVGPRPERPEFVDELTSEIPLWPCRHLLKPGLSGWAQTRFRYASGVDASKEKLAYDLYYLKNASLLLDLQIILSTLRSVAKGSR